MNIVDIVSGDQSLIIYRPTLTKITGSINSAILLSQIMYRWKKNDKQPFYKFKEPCSHKWYKKGDSWLEELGFTKREYENAMKKIAIKLQKNNKLSVHQKYIEYWTSPYNITYFTLHITNLNNALAPLYGISHQKGFPKSLSATSEINKRGFPNTEKLDYEEFTSWDALNILDDIVNSPKKPDYSWIDKITERELLGAECNASLF